MNRGGRGKKDGKKCKISKTMEESNKKEGQEGKEVVLSIH